ncbi:VC0807 family protein [Peribacillus sp. FSL H8-0477]|uniref:VC0807 family protein n=1 Tax=Peribacillus sp. FSL H8-0477 TaxID=2921388 RepID=UPI0030FA1302
MNKYILFLDLLFYLALPLLIWNYGRVYMGDYTAILVSSSVGILYSIYRFYTMKKVSFTGMYILISLLIKIFIEFFAGSALQLLWNHIYYDFVTALFFLVTIVIKKPASLYLTLDIVELQGNDRALMKDLFYRGRIFSVFNVITLVFCFRELVLAVTRIILVGRFGVDAYDEGIIYQQVISWIFTIIAGVGFIYVYKLLGPETRENPK